VSEGTLAPPANKPAGASPGAPAGGRSAAPGWQVWTALWIVYIVWGSTYLAIRIVVETIPPLLGAGARFGIAGLLMVGFLALRRGFAAVKPTRAQLGGAALVGLLLPGANAVVSVAEQEVPSSIAALLIASVPLWVILLRAVSGDRVSLRGAGSVLVGFAGVALLVRPGEQSGDATVLGLLAVVGAALMWASGSFASPKLSLPKDPLTSVGWQMLLGGIAITVVGLAIGEGGDVHVDAFSTRSLLALGYLVVFGSWVAYTAYAWLLQNAPISKVSTYAYVNPVVAIFLGWLVLDEVVSSTTILGASIIVVSVALVVRTETPRRAQRAQARDDASR
jgi:drug/metabolite transporter (DMT)-like permease